MLFRNAIEFTQMTFCLVLLNFDPVDILAVLHESFVVIDPLILKLQNVKHIVRRKQIDIHDAVQMKLTRHDEHQCFRLEHLESFS